MDATEEHNDLTPKKTENQDKPEFENRIPLAELQATVAKIKEELAKVIVGQEAL